MQYVGQTKRKLKERFREHFNKKKKKCFYDDALTELVNHYANRTLIVSCTKDYT